MKIAAIIQARLGATRLPRKVLLDLEGKTVLERVIERVKSSKYVDEVIVATTDNRDNTEIPKLCKKNNIPVYCGSEDDVLDRYYQTAKLFKADNIVRITADCPMMDPAIIDDVVKLHLDSEADYTSNILKETYPDGEDVEVFTFKALEKAWELAKLKSEREHVTPFIRKNPDIFKLRNKENNENLSGKRWTLDEPRDYDFIKIVYSGLYKNKPFFGMKDILEYSKLHPEIEGINQDITRNEGYLKSLKNDKELNSDENKNITKTL